MASTRWRSAVGGTSLAVALLAGCASSATVAGPPSTSGSAPGSSAAVGTAVPGTGAARPATVTDLVLDPGKDYGNEYADGILPVGDGRFVLDGPRRGSIYLCRQGGGGGGASKRGPWFVNGDTEYDLHKKIAVQGTVDWQGQMQTTIDGATRIITTNDVPEVHPTGQFPVAPDDPAYQYDRNPNTIKEQTLTFRLPAAPTLAASPQCMGGESGVMLTGVALFNGFDAGNRDAGAWEVQDGCEGHPQISGEYHYHTLSSCIADAGASTVIGYALDGFPITGPTIGPGNILTTKDLDECHGITSTVTLDGASVTTYHYVMTQDFPYSVSCFRGAPAPAPRSGTGPPGPPGAGGPPDGPQGGPPGGPQGGPGRPPGG